jgi:hypothetical protein
MTAWKERISRLVHRNSNRLDERIEMLLGQEISLYRESQPVPTDHPSRIVPLLEELCRENGITHIPELRSLSNPSLGVGTYALVHKDCILTTNPLIEMFGRKLAAPDIPPEKRKNLESAEKSILAHELCHLIHGDQIVGRQEERRADRFVHFLGGDINNYGKILMVSEIATGQIQELYLSQIKAKAPEQLGAAKKDIERVRDKGLRDYGSREERLAALSKPFTEAEAAQFRKAVAKYNMDMERSASRGWQK